MSNYAASWPVEPPPDELVEATIEFCRLLRKAGWEPSGDLIAWAARRDAQRVLWDRPLRP